MNGFRIGLTLASIAALGACSADASKVIIANPGPLAYVRFVNAIPDSGTQDWRFVDAVEGSPTTQGLTFRGVFPGASYQSATPGSRHLRIFQSSLDPTFADPTKTTPEIVGDGVRRQHLHAHCGYALHDRGDRKPSRTENGEVRDPDGQLH